MGKLTRNRLIIAGVICVIATIGLILYWDNITLGSYSGRIINGHPATIPPDAYVANYLGRFMIVGMMALAFGSSVCLGLQYQEKKVKNDG